MRFCVQPHCLAYATPGSSRCEKHGGKSGWSLRPPANPRNYKGDWPAISKKVKQEWRAKHGNVCPGYKKPPHEAIDLEVDHIDPEGTNERANLTILCGSCNKAKAADCSHLARNQARRANR